MNAKADFLDGTVMWTEAPRRPPDLRRCQGAMFLDRPDLWPVTRRKSRQPPPEQRSLFEDDGCLNTNDSEDTGG